MSAATRLQPYQLLLHLVALARATGKYTSRKVKSACCVEFGNLVNHILRIDPVLGRQPVGPLKLPETNQGLRHSLTLPRSHAYPQTTLSGGSVTISGSATRTQTLIYAVKAFAGHIFSIACLPVPFFHRGGGREPSGCASGASSKPSTCCINRMMRNDISLYAKFCPRHCAGISKKYHDVSNSVGWRTKRGPA